MIKSAYIHVLFVVIALLCLPSVSLADNNTQEMKQYTVVKGDTLWGIADKELKDSFLWPKIWKENPEIKNPDRLYPGQIVRIPLYLYQKEKTAEAPAPRQPEAPPMPVEKPREEKKTAVRLKPLVNQTVLMSSGYIEKSVSWVGRVTGSPEDRRIVGKDDIIYVETNSPVKIGDRFYIVRAENEIYHPVTGKKVGYEVEVLGVAEIIQFEFGETKARIAQMFNDVAVGNLLLPYYEMIPPMTTGDFRKPNIAAVVLAGKSLRLANGNLDIVFIDKGERDGIEVGDMFRTVRVGTHKTPNGVIQIINTRETTATAIVRKFTYPPVTAGNMVMQLE